MKTFNKEQKILAKNYIKKFLKKYNISIRWMTKTGTGGCADYYKKENKKRKIKIPRPINPYNLGVGLHEIGHVVLGHLALYSCGEDKNKLIDQRPQYVHEYEAEEFAITNLKKIGFYTKEYKIEAIRYVMEVIAKEINKYNSVDDVPKKIIKWTGLNLKMWKKARKIIVPRQKIDNFQSKNEIVIEYLMPKKKNFISKLNK